MKLLFFSALTVFFLSGYAITKNDLQRWEYKSVYLNAFENGFYGRAVTDVVNDSKNA